MTNGHFFNSVGEAFTSHKQYRFLLLMNSTTPIVYVNLILGQSLIEFQVTEDLFFAPFQVRHLLTAP